MEWNGAQWNGTYCMCMEQHSMEHGTHGMERSTMERNIFTVWTWNGTEHNGTEHTACVWNNIVWNTEHLEWNRQRDRTYCMCMEQHSMEQGTHGMERSTMERNILHVYGTT